MVMKTKKRKRGTRRHGQNIYHCARKASKKTERIKSRFINLRDIEKNLDSLMKKFGKDNELVFTDYKVLGTGEIKTKLIIKAKEFSKSAEEKITKAGGKAITLSRKSEDKNINKGKKVEGKKEDILKNRDNKEKPKK